MSLINISDLSFSYHNNYESIFDKVSIQIDTDWKLGLIGANGKGKTTLLKILNGELEYSGNINSKVDFTTYTTKMTALDNKDADLQLQLNNIPNLYVDKTTYNTKMTSLDLKDTELTTLVNSKVDSNVYSTNISNLQI